MIPMAVTNVAVIHRENRGAERDVKRALTERAHLYSEDRRFAGSLLREDGSEPWASGYGHRSDDEGHVDRHRDHVDPVLDPCAGSTLSVLWGTLTRERNLLTRWRNC